MLLVPEQDDAIDFICAVNRTIEGLQVKYEPPTIVLVKIDNWFGPRWLGFSGKVIGALGVWKDALTIPPFVPNRVVSERRFTSPLYEEIDFGKPLHRNIPSTAALGRKAAEIEPGVTLVWYSGNSTKTRRGSLMVYQPEGSSYSSWYAQWEKRDFWQIAQTNGIDHMALLALTEAASVSSAVIAN